MLKFIETKSRMMITKSWGWGGTGSCLMGMELQICKMKKF